MNYQKVDFEKILNYFNIRNAHRSGSDIQFSCPFPDHYRGDRNPSAGINTGSGVWHCFSCGRKGTLISFVADLEGVSQAVAARWIREGFDDSFGRETTAAMLENAIKEKESGPKTNSPIPKAALDIFYVDWDLAYEAYNNKSLPKRLTYIFDRGFLPHTLKAYSIGYDSHSKRITIPLHNGSGDLLGFKGRATKLSQSPKYLGVGDREYTYYGFPTCKTSDLVFGIETVNPSDDYVIIVEGEFDALMLRQNGFETAISLGGSNTSDSQIQMIKENCSRAILLLDPDKAGKKAERNLSKSLLPFLPLKIAEVPKGLDPAEMTTDQITQAITQAKNPLQKHI
jgi:DNA primase